MADEKEARQVMTAVMNAVADAELWPDALDATARFFGGVGAMVEFHALDGTLVRLGPRGSVFEQRYLDIYLQHYAATCPRSQWIKRPDAGAVQREEMVGPEQVLDRMPYYADFLAPQKLKYHLALRLRRTPEEFGVLAIQRLAVDGDATDEDVAWMYELAPFFRAAFRARALLGDVSPGVEGLIGALAALDMPLAFLRGDGRVMFQNEAADAVTAREPGVDWGTLIARWRETTAGVEDSATVPLRSPLGTWSARVIDLGGAFDQRAVNGGIYVVLFVAAPRDGRPATARSRGLTASETAVLRLLVSGKTPQEVAREQRVSIATVRTHISRLHEKFGVGRTLDVVRIAIAERWDLD